MASSRSSWRACPRLACPVTSPAVGRTAPAATPDLASSRLNCVGRKPFQNVSRRVGSGIRCDLCHWAWGYRPAWPKRGGKSTLIRLLAGLARPSLGHVSILGGDPRHSPEARRQIGLVPQQDGVFELDSAAEVVELAAVLNGLDEPKLRAAQALEMVELDPDMDRPVGTFSKGMRQRVKIAQAIVHDPAILMLDEPLNGLDPRQRREMIGLFHHLGDSGKTVLVSSHVLDEVERFGSHVLVVTKGRLAAQGDFRAIRELLDNYPMRVRIRSAQARAVAASLVASGALSGCTVNDENEVEITTDEAAQFRRELVTTARHLGARLEEVTPVDDDLESVFRYLVGGPSS